MSLESRSSNNDDEVFVASSEQTSAQYMGITIFVVAYFVWTTSCIQRAINVGDELRHKATVDDITLCPPVVVSANHHDSISDTSSQPRRQMIRKTIKSIEERLEMEWNTTTLHTTPNTTSVDDDGCTRKVLTNLHIPKQLRTLDHSAGQVISTSDSFIH